jgi:hypothetical protein
LRRVGKKNEVDESTLATYKREEEEEEEGG